MSGCYALYFVTHLFLLLCNMVGIMINRISGCRFLNGAYKIRAKSFGQEIAAGIV